MATKTEGQHTGEFILSEAAGTRSRKPITVASWQNLKAGHVLGKVTLGAGSSAAGAGNAGDGAMGAITVGNGAKAGNYTLAIIEPGANAGDFMVEDPDGINVGSGDVGTAFAGGGLSFTLADGAADFVAGDTFTITVAEGSGEYKEWNPVNTDGSENVAAILYDNVDASAAAKAGVVAIVRDAEVRASDLQYFTGADAGNKTAAINALEALGVIAL